MIDNRLLLEMSGDHDDVSGAIHLDPGLYIVGFKFRVAAFWPIFSVEIENISNEDDKAFVGEQLEADIKVGTRFEAKRKIRITGGEYVVSVGSTGTDDWKVQLLKP